MTDSKSQVADVAVKGHTIAVRRPTDAQAVIMHRYAKIGMAAMQRVEMAERQRVEMAESAPDTAASVLEPLYQQGMDSVSEMLDMVERLVVRQEDRDLLVNLMKNGELELGDLMPITEAFVETKKKNAPKAARVK